MKIKSIFKSAVSIVLVLCILLSFCMIGVSAVAGPSVIDENAEVFTLYSGGNASTVMEYDCGNAVANDGSKSYLRIIQNTTEQEYLSYCSKLRQLGYTAVMYNKTIAADEGYNCFSSFISPDNIYKIYTYFFPYFGETRIIVDTQSDTVTGFNYTSETGESVEPLICMYGLSMSENGYSNSTTTDYSTGKVNSGALTVIRMPDNSLFLHDGGALDQWDDQACDEFLQFCRDLTGKGEDEKIIINTWFISHAHTDHYQGLPRFFSVHHDKLDLKYIMYNIDIERTYTTRDIYREVRMVASYYPEVKYYKPHTGESFEIAGVDFDVIYALEDRYLPNENGEIITDYPEIENGKTVTEYDLGGTYREYCYESDGKSDFNDTSTVLRVTFSNSGKSVDSILYADMNLAENILWDIYPDSYLKTDIMMIPHHGHDAHPELCAMAKPDIFIFTQHRGAIYGADGDLSTKDPAGQYRPALYNNYLEMQSAIEIEGSKTYWQGNETAIISPFGVKQDIPNVTEDTEAPEGYAVYLKDVRSFEYGGWSVDGGEDVISGKDFSDSVESVTTTNKRYTFKRADVLSYNERFLIMHDQSKNIMSYSAINPSEKAGSIVLNQNGNAEGIFYFGVDESGTVSESNVYLSHSDRDDALWISKQKTSNAYGNKSIAKGDELSYIEDSAAVEAFMGGEKRYHHVYFTKGIGPVYNDDGTINSVKNGAYWYSVEGADAEGVQERYFHINPDHDLMYGIANSANVQIENFGNGEFLIYSIDGNNYHVLTCDTATGAWGAVTYTPEEVAANFDSLKVRLYKYASDSGDHNIALQGANTFNVLEDTDGATVLNRISDKIVVSDVSNNYIHIPCSGTQGKIGYFWIKFESDFVSSSKRTTDDYKVGVYYRNDDGTDTKVGEVNVHVQGDVLMPETANFSTKSGVIKKGSSETSNVMTGTEEIETKCRFTVQFNTLNGFVTKDIYITADMLTDADGNPVDLSKAGEYKNLRVTYDGFVLCDDFTLVVYEKYIVTFVNYNGDVLKTQEVFEGESASAPQSPTRNQDKEYVYTFTGWDKDFSSVSENMTVTAEFSKEKQVYYLRGTFNDWEAVDEMTEISDGIYSFEISLPEGYYEYKAANSKYAMQWPQNGNNTLSLEFASDVTFVLDTNADTLTATAVKNGFVVTFVDYDGREISKQSVVPGQAAVAPADPYRGADVNYVYTFAGWDKDFSSVTEDMVVTATYIETPQVYYIRGSFNDWTTADVMSKNEDGTYSFAVTLPAGTYEYKAANHDYSMEWPLGANKTLVLDKASDVTFTLDTVNHTIEAVYTPVAEAYNVVFKNWDGSIISEQSVAEGSAATAPEAPTRPADVNYVYTFAGWDKDFSSITEDTEITAFYNIIPQVYFIRGSFNDWSTVGEMTKNEDGTHTYEVTLEAGDYEYKAANDDYSMQWPIDGNKNLHLDKNSVVTFTLNVVDNTVEVEIEPIIVEYSVVFKNWNGEILSEQSVTEGSAATAPEAPVKPADVNYVYTFAGWDKDFSSITEDTEITATFTETPQVYYIRGSFNDWSTVGEMTKNEDGTYTYEVTLQAGDYEYKAANDDYSMQWPVDGNKNLHLDKNSVVTFTLNVIDNTLEVEIESIIVEYSVVFKNWDGSVISEQMVAEGVAATAPEAPVKPADVNYVYTFAGWDKDFSSITEDTEITATFTEIPQVYYIRGSFNDWSTVGEMTKNEDGTYTYEVTLQAGDYEYKAANDDYSMQWPVDGNKNLHLDKNSVVTFTLNVIDNTLEVEIEEEQIGEYTVTFVDYDGTVIDEQKIKAGEAATAPDDPERAADAQYTYAFAYWDGNFTNVQSDVTVTAKYIAFTNKYYVTFIDGDGKFIETQTVAYGTSAEAPKVPEKSGYTFIGWDKEFTNITENTVVTAQYKKNTVVVTPTTTGRLQIEVAGGTSFTISVNSGAARPQGTSYLNTKAPKNANVTVVASTVNGNKFVGWMNSAGAIVSTSESFTFTTSGNDYFKAMYQTEVEGVNLVVYKNDRAAGGKGQILDMQYYTAGDELTIPDDPTLAGYDFAGWNMTDDEIQAELSKGNDVTVLANWTRAIVYVTVTAEGGAVEGATADNKYAAYGAVTVKADEAADGMKFAYWTNAEGKVVSYDAEYKFYPAADTYLKANFVAENAEIEYQAIASLAADPTTQGEKITYTMSWDVPEAVGEFSLAGLMVVDAEDYNADTFYHGSGDSKLFDRALSGSMLIPKNTYGIAKGASYYGHTYYACTWVQYVDANGETVTVYSDMVTVEKLAE